MPAPSPTRERPMFMPALPEAPLISVLIPNYNYAGFLAEALESLLAQTYLHFEAIICDDGSTDSSIDVARTFVARDDRISLVEKKNGGVASALNKAFEKSSGNIIMLLDADDTFAAEKLERLVAYWREHRQAGMVMHAMDVIDAEGQQLYGIPRGGRPETGWIAPRVRARGGRLRNLPAGGLAFHRAVAEELFPLPEAALRSVADGYLYTLAALMAEVGYVPEALAGYRLHGANLTGTAQFTLESARKYGEGVGRFLDAVNDKLVSLGEAPLSLDDHLNVQEQRLIEGLLADASTPVRARTTGRVLVQIWKDDLYRLPRKLAGILAYGVAGLLPRRWRAGWLSAILRPG